ncbi:MAG: endonuclease/exonuclease/phosphatase family protein [Vibrio sp.]
MNRIVGCFIALMAVLTHASTASAQPITVMTWNMEWLTLGPSRFGPARTHKDYAAMNAELQRTAPDIIAFQEVDSPQALERVIGNDYRIYFSDRRQSRYKKTRQFDDVNQYTGIAIRRSLATSDPTDVDLLPTHAHSKLRFATYVILQLPQENIHMLSVHLKAGCKTAYHAQRRRCRVLKQQGQALNHWIQQRIKHKQAYIILGDINHQLAYPGDWLWADLAAHTAPHPVLSTRYTTARCIARSASRPTRTVTFHHLIDHIIHSRNVVMRSAEQQHFARQDVLKYHLSDHCPIVTRLTVAD